jgi:hypothetical protein
MPLWSYTIMHGDAKLTPENRATLRAWSAAALSHERTQEPKAPADEKEKGPQ